MFEKYDDHSFHFWAGRYGVHIYLPDIWNSQLDYIPKKQWKRVK